MILINYLIITPIIFIISLAVTSLINPLQKLKEKYELDYHRNDKGLLVYFISKVLNCVKCLTGHLTYTILFIICPINITNIIIISILTYFNMKLVVWIEKKIYLHLIN